jgi:hypothetical protein
MKVKVVVALAWGIGLLGQRLALSAPLPGPLAGKRVLVHLKNELQAGRQPALCCFRRSVRGLEGMGEGRNVLRCCGCGRP